MKGTKSILLSVLSCLAVFLAPSGTAAAAPVPDVKLNGLDGPVVLRQADALTVTIAMDSGGMTANCDWWFGLQTPSGFLILSASGWGTTLAPAYQGQLVSFPAATLMSLPLASVPGGTYTFYFVVDTTADGDLDDDAIYYDTATLIVATPTAQGAPTGAVTAQTVGPSGGTVSTPDGKITLNIPAGALASNTNISITPVTNTAHNGVGSSFELGPAGQTFAVPVQVTIQLTDQDLATGSIEARTIAFQDSNGYWHAADTAIYNSTAKTVTVTTDHFSSATVIETFRLVPSNAEVKVTEGLSLSVEDCVIVKEKPRVISKECAVWGPGTPNVRTTGWKVNGIDGGNSTVGTIAEASNVTGRFTAPAKVPSPDTVTASAFYEFSMAPFHFVATLFSDIKIIDAADYAGTITIMNYQPQEYTVKLDVKFTLDPTVQGGKYYKIAGTMTLTTPIVTRDPFTQVALASCAPLVTGAVPFEVGSGTTHLQIYDTPGNTYNLQFIAMATISVRCTDNTTNPPTASTVPYPVPAIMPLCPAPVNTFTDINHLQGFVEYDCGLFQQSSAIWDLTRSATQ